MCNVRIIYDELHKTVIQVTICLPKNILFMWSNYIIGDEITSNILLEQDIADSADDSLEVRQRHTVSSYTVIIKISMIIALSSIFKINECILQCIKGELQFFYV